jgi:hypothetical protein
MRPLCSNCALFFYGASVALSGPIVALSAPGHESRQFVHLSIEVGYQFNRYMSLMSTHLRPNTNAATEGTIALSRGSPRGNRLPVKFALEKIPP